MRCRWAEGTPECSDVCMGFQHGNLSESEVKVLASSNLYTCVCIDNAMQEVFCAIKMLGASE